MSWKKTICTSLTASALALMPMQALWATPSQSNVDTLTKVYSLLVDDHYTHPNEDVLLQGAIQGMLSKINDPFTTYLTPEQYKQFTGAINQIYAGIGATLGQSEDGQWVVIQSVSAGHPAAQEGIKPGDRILQIDDVSMAVHKLEDVASKLIGAAGTTVKLKIEHTDGSTQTYTLTRADIELPEVIAQDLGSGISYLRILSFGERTAEEFKTQLSDLEKRQSKGLVLDLRGNGGGYVSAALEIADSLLKKGAILIVHDDKGQEQEIDADAEGTDLPMVVLVDKNTASASEMLAGALQKNGRAKLIGNQTFGKGTMQVPVELPNGGYLKVSIDRWELADGTSPDHVGLTPDIHLTTPVSILNAAMQQVQPGRVQTLTLSRTNGTGYVNGIELYDVPPVKVQGDRVYLPFRYAVETLGNEVDWNEKDHAVHSMLSGHRVDLDFKENVLLMDGKPIALKQPYLFFDGTTYLSSDAMEALTGHKLEVSDQSVTIHST